MTKLSEQEINDLVKEIIRENDKIYLMDVNYGENYLFIMGKNKTRTIRLPKNITKEWIINQVNKFLNTTKSFINLSKITNNIIKGSGCMAYATSYGIGIDNLFPNTAKKIANLFTKMLGEYGVSYNLEYSDKYWVLRIKISKSRDNLERLTNLINDYSKIKNEAKIAVKV